MAKNLYVNVSQFATPTDGKHLVNLETVQGLISKKIKDPVRVVLSSNFDGTYDSTEKTLTQTTAEELVIDGITVAENDRILLVGQDDATQNGIYIVTTLGTSSVEAVLTRAEDFNDSAKAVPNCIVPVMQGVQNSDTNWQLINDTAVSLDSTSLSFSKFKGAATVNVFEAQFSGDGATKEFPITHGLNREGVVVKVYDHATKEECLFAVEVTSANVVTIKSDVVLESTDTFDVVVVA